LHGASEILSRDILKEIALSCDKVQGSAVSRQSLDHRDVLAGGVRCWIKRIVVEFNVVFEHPKLDSRQILARELNRLDKPVPPGYACTAQCSFQG
jgi:hypothetical protein